MILTEQEIKDRYRVIRRYTASITGTEVILSVEDATRELVQSHLEALKGIEELKELITNAEKSIKEVIRHFKGE
jgi:lysyl-tRNA synthetase class I